MALNPRYISEIEHMEMDRFGTGTELGAKYAETRGLLNIRVRLRKLSEMRKE